MKRLFIILIFFSAACATTPFVDNEKMAEGYYLKGVSHLQEKNYELALVEFQRSVQTDNKNKESYYALGIVHDTQGKLKDAETYYLRALDIDSQFSEAYNALGVVYYKQQRWKEALKMFNKALENKLYTTPHLPYLNMGDLHMSLKEYDNAAAAYRESKRYAKYEITLYKLGMALFEAGKTHEAIAEFNEGISLSQNNATMHYGLALAHLKDGNKKASLAGFRRVMELAPQSEVGRKAKDYIATLR